MNIAIFCDNLPEEILKELTNNNISFTIFQDVYISYYIDNKENCLYYKNQKIDANAYDGAIVYVGNVKFLSLISEYFEKNNKWVSHNSFTILTMKNKYRTLQYFKEANIPIPKTIYSSPMIFDAFPEMYLYNLGKKMVVKPNDSSWGQGVKLIDIDNNIYQEDTKYDPISKKYFRTTYPRLYENCIFQVGKDLRVITIGNQVLGGFWRENKNGIASNLHKGGEGKKAEISDSIKELSLKVLHSIPGNCLISGIDFMFDEENKPVVIEINSHPGLMLERDFFDYNLIAKMFVEELIKSYNEFQEKKEGL